MVKCLVEEGVLKVLSGRKPWLEVSSKEQKDAAALPS